ncbi:MULTISPECIES: alkene reductase [unclassified Oceanobacter]|uniref:alkene reductase n=1 Tax=unclassified Oceanobacter TaxID=2620260 RepID=UPI002732CACF|nr:MULTISPECIES: alkene reductase [unclassified Oceanobacter]MDP2607715.1 alkene reductase [Oceanobacter sp. 1_MG-2023]MDP2611101.1 alkene reductase [Oceanobacter sp. 2_MG-2023]
MSNLDVLFTPVSLGDIELANRFVMAPLTRCRAVGHLPNALMAEYYGQRASAGLVITECTMVTEGTSAFGNDPGVYAAEQVDAWKQTADAVHARGGKVFMQIWHAGRAAHPLLNHGKEAVSASAIAIEDEVHTPEGKQPYTVPRALTTTEIADIVQDFRRAAANAIRAGFDGVEVHGANGYLIDQFLRDSSNQRTDAYGGSLANRARLLFDVLDAVTAEIGSGRVGLRLSPLNSFNSMRDSDPLGWMQYLATGLNRYQLAYLHVMRADFFGIQSADVVPVAREYYNGSLIVNMGYSPEEAAAALSARHADAVAFGTGLLANPDLPARVKAGAELNTPNPDTFYTSGAEGYTDYPSMGA